MAAPDTFESPGRGQPAAALVVEIALAAGFCDQSHFTRTFKRLTGIAPSQYREALRAAKG